MTVVDLREYLASKLVGSVLTIQFALPICRKRGTAPARRCRSTANAGHRLPNVIVMGAANFRKRAARLRGRFANDFTQGAGGLQCRVDITGNDDENTNVKSGSLYLKTKENTENRPIVTSSNLDQNDRL